MCIYTYKNFLWIHVDAMKLQLNESKGMMNMEFRVGMAGGGRLVEII